MDGHRGSEGPMNVQDGNAEPIEVGSRVTMWNAHEYPPGTLSEGTVAELIPFEPDEVPINPKVVVEFDDGDWEAFTTYVADGWSLFDEDPTWECEELVVL